MAKPKAGVNRHSSCPRLREEGVNGQLWLQNATPECSGAEINTEIRECSLRRTETGMCRAAENSVRIWSYCKSERLSHFSAEALFIQNKSLLQSWGMAGLIVCLSNGHVAMVSIPNFPQYQV